MSRKDTMERFAALASETIKFSEEQKKQIRKEREAREAKEAAKADVRHDLNIANGYVSKYNSSKSRGIEFLLSLDTFSELVETEICAYTGKTMKHEGGGGDRLTLERVNPFLGYIEGNVVAVTSAANTEKSKLDDFLKSNDIPIEMKIKLLRKATYILEKKLKSK